ncbi:hypothetical protein GCM10009836_45750 [Pseudonocardia ailaonensis]|uniref:Uncharacterized protein n=1 Tax=Pseudonocardia ailaonensis TaxID=367279 RepID=A0ABN2NAH8_9PSEU
MSVGRALARETGDPRQSITESDFARMPVSHPGQVLGDLVLTKALSPKERSDRSTQMAKRYLQCGGFFDSTILYAAGKVLRGPKDKDSLDDFTSLVVAIGRRSLELGDSVTWVETLRLIEKYFDESRRSETVRLASWAATRDTKFWRPALKQYMSLVGALGESQEVEIVVWGYGTIGATALRSGNLECAVEIAELIDASGYGNLFSVLQGKEFVKTSGSRARQMGLPLGEWPEDAYIDFYAFAQSVYDADKAVAV